MDQTKLSSTQSSLDFILLPHSGPLGGSWICFRGSKQTKKKHPDSPNGGFPIRKTKKNPRLNIPLITINHYQSPLTAMNHHPLTTVFLGTKAPVASVGCGSPHFQVPGASPSAWCLSRQRRSWDRASGHVAWHLANTSPLPAAPTMRQAYVIIICAYVYIHVYMYICIYEYMHT